MPELPEVETTRRGLDPVLADRRISAVRVHHERMLRYQPIADDFITRLEGSTANRIARRGKYLLISLDAGFTWVVHLGMSGRIAVTSTSETAPVHTRLEVVTEADEAIRMVDPRTFGFMSVLDSDELKASSIERLGPDALNALPSARHLASSAEGRRVAIKSLLLDQRYLAGLGNIYADEALFVAGVAGSRAAGSVTGEEFVALRHAIREVLAAALNNGGTSLGDLAYLLPDGRAGRHLNHLAVYGRAGSLCRRCGCVIVREVINGRSSHRCPACQQIPGRPAGHVNDESVDGG